MRLKPNALPMGQLPLRSSVGHTPHRHHTISSFHICKEIVLSLQSLVSVHTSYS
eukprot:FN608337.1.p2 GENE.FN608337.1~~FN608337.1.p2  ORF type:complete len:54 (-),score=0.53 FN608337.1:25-186(-)